MIRLRSAIERALEHRWLGPLIILALALLLVFVVFHTTMDAAHGDGLGFTCIAIAAITFLILRLRRTVIRVAVPSGLVNRGPPSGARLVAAPIVSSVVSPPLRL